LLEYKGFEIHWEGHATVRIEDNGFTALVDPFFSKVSSEVEADLVLITRNEDGNYDPEFLEKIVRKTPV